MNFIGRERRRVADLITNMVLAGATEEELADAIAYSKDVIAAETDYNNRLLTSGMNHSIDLLAKKYGVATRENVLGYSSYRKEI